MSKKGKGNKKKGGYSDEPTKKEIISLVRNTEDID